MYVSVLKIIIQLTVEDMDCIIQKYVDRHFDDNPLESLYDEKCFVEFVDNSTPGEPNKDTDSIRTQESRILLIFILLNPKDVLNKFVLYEIDAGDYFSNDHIFHTNVSLVQSYYSLWRGQNNLLMYILKDILFQQRSALHIRFKYFLNDMINYEVMTADDIINELYITYLNGVVIGNYFKRSTLIVILVHIDSIVRKKRYMPRTNYVQLITTLLRTMSLLRECEHFSKTVMDDPIRLTVNILRSLLSSNVLTDEHRNVIYLNGLEPLGLTKIWPAMTTLEIIEEYEERCLIVHQQLRRDPRCHPKLRSYAQSFKLDREAYIRHMIMHSLDVEYNVYATSLTVTFFSNFGWANQMIAYENVMRITAETSLIALMYVETFSENIFLLMLFGIAQFSWNIESVIPREVVRPIFLKTLSSMKPIVGRTRYGFMYNYFLKRIQKENLSLPTKIYFNEICGWIHLLQFKCVPRKHALDCTNCTCDKSSYCEYHSFLIKNKLAAKYNAYLFVCECIKLPMITDTLDKTGIHHCYDRLLRKLCRNDKLA
ncbi:PREDICTED: uncharacterized protein LOC105462768 [Wasmannia auropunctata]|uniref:uncharacterized protein LOC105462768 n=1 Tax=Wasmannia auropunctata TaxID=64793 RepID=UPI0005EE6BAE|nr:PREDICTED: uncharacterized protein LOC105462768 [Wasmannia auropunctata]